MPVNRLTIESNTVTAAHQSAGVSVAAITGDYTVKLFIQSLTGGARVVIEESVNAFSTTYELAVFSSQGSLPPEGVMVSFRKREAAGTDLAGTAGAVLRVNVQELTGGSPSITYNAYVEY